MLIFWLDHAGTLIGVPSDLVDVSDGALSQSWRASVRGGRLFIGPDAMASAELESTPQMIRHCSAVADCTWLRGA